ncbi:MAG: fatty acid oxidation complex subunit alpha FadB [Cobetia sp.]|jgi:3-hydroxyacyl-CoA dehydrogenase/enoyl-CoA hydratase/3-hydroxybutyryl-CoA epimerase/enoyl-CoA isomerase|uniref:fatty acid oxidation complex subunit alpha FadB n=1 Tax=unclassified Cobetia TaxID=2609414 RepID=UPI000C357D2C|nr:MULTISPECIES: fatty acid oxidation complex subunit alpha FadB [unclassified Cobetia]MBR9798186.1 fatty acid oxidation complex subunit alpha FadB [Gammaproteobacteria bacterium]MBF07759.1 fatty acid oxidation complex subunit alpha FadB [Cobetia sp.]MBK10665.1 fatty acid oxidation complex subunit alpha FadB [Cobetia sp.]MCK8068527.1 fatty acid oxidation complex subunit alpha FadB [Cobetia sp. 1CM21F]BBO55289.1 fatty acid oxidation complex subunit alpha [Cobetia sp. AM6]|tara:strand:+ start:18927 stop:21077 length:2151 start_codon:yes stop_codon:yes gene_type:complete
MIYSGKTLTVEANQDAIALLTLDLEGESVNKLASYVLKELGEAVEAIKATADLKGLVIRSAKEAFVVGADITEFHQMFEKDEAFLIDMNMNIHGIFNAIEDLPFPTVTAINGLALGGGCEITLTTDFRVMADSAKIGLPETKLGIIPGWAGCVRLPRLIGADNAIEWICGGTENRADKALAVGAVDAVLPVAELDAAALDILARANAGELDYQARRLEKTSPLKLNAIEQMMAFETAKGFVAGKAGPHYPAPVEAIKVIQKGAGESRERAQAIEAKTFARMALTDVAFNLVGLFMNDQVVKKKAKGYEKQASEIKQAAVLGAGIMGGGIAYQSASKGTPILMKDINGEAIELGLKEARKLFGKGVERGKLTTEKMAQGLSNIRPTLSYGDFGNVDLVVEAVVENPKVKASVLAELEDNVAEDAILTSNTSTISITRLAESLKRPENFCGMHFFNPVHRMPLVEVIRGEKSSDAAIAATVAYARQMGKTPIVVNDCPGFLVNRVLFPYFGGFSLLVEKGADYQRVDKVMEKFGWPMGPAYLLDVVGMDTAVHANAVMAEGFPDRMARDGKTAIQVMYDNKRLGQKNDLGFYRYEEDRKGKPKKLADDEAQALVAQVVSETREFSDEDIIARMMVPLCMETIRCLEDDIVGSPAEADMALIYGIGFPPFRGGALRYVDAMGVAEFVALADSLADELGPLYRPTEALRERAKRGEAFYS